MRNFYFRRLLPVIAMMLASVTAASAYDFISGSIYYNITSSTDLTVDVTYGSTSSNSYSGDVTIPSTVTSNGTTYTVTGIGDSAFYKCSSLKSVTIPDSVTSIEKYAFRYCDSLASVTMGKGITSIGESAFAHCTSLASIKIPDSVTSIGRSAFYECTSLAGIEIPDNVDSIPFCAFYKCTSLASVTMGESVKSIGESAFAHCTSLTGMTIGEGVKSIGESAFSQCTSLASIEIPDGVTSIGRSAFYECTSLAGIEIPDDVDSIPYCAFYECTSLASVTIGKGVTSIGRSSFYECTSLASVTIGDGVTSIGMAAFYKCTSLASVTIGKGVKSIGRYAFYECTSLQRVTMPEGITELGDSIFYNCSALKDVTIPAHLTENAYSTYVVGCDSINSVTINGSGEIGNSAFKNCTTLTTLTIGDSVTAIGDSAFYRCSSLASVTIPNSVMSIGTHAFCRCTSLTSIEIPDSVTSIGSIAFSRCSSLESINIPNSVTSLGDNAFYYCTSLASVTIGSGLTSIERSTFYNCTSLTSIEIPNNVTSIDDKTFYNCTSLTSITIGKSVKSIGRGAFGKCMSLRSMYCLMEDASSVTCGDTVFLWDDNGVKDYTIVRNAVLFVPDEGALETYRAADQWDDFKRVAVTRYMDEGETIAAGDKLNIISTTTSSSTTENIKAIAETTSDEDSESSDSETLYAVVTFGSKGASEVWETAEEEKTLDVVGPFSNYVKGKVAATNEDGNKYDPTSEDNNSFDAPIAGAYLMMEPKANGTIYVAVKKQGDVYVCDETGTAVDYLIAELPNGEFEYYETDTEETSESESASDTEEATTDTCIRYSFPALAGKTYFVTSTNDNCLSVAGYAFEPDSLESPFAVADTLTISDSSEDNLTESPSPADQYDVTLNRSFTKGGWTSMVLPFSVSPSMLNETFGDSTAIVYFNRVSSDTLYLTEHYHDMIVAGTPMFIRPDTTATSLTFKCVTYGEPTLSYGSDYGTWSVDTLTLPSIEDNIIGCENNKSDWELKASYVSVQGEENDSTHYYMIGFKYETDTIMVADENGDSIEKENTVMKNYFFEYNKVMSIKGLRAWLEDVTDDSSAARLITVSRNGIIDDDDTETTGIINALTGNSGTATATRRSNSGNGNIYNLHGQMVRHASEGTSGLPQGIYIVNGKKIIVE